MHHVIYDVIDRGCHHGKNSTRDYEYPSRECVQAER